MISTLDLYEGLSDVAFQAVAKYVTAAAAARALKNDLPPRPEYNFPKTIFSGSLGRHLKTVLSSGTSKAVNFSWTLLQGVKRACLPPGDDVSAKALNDHREILTSPPELPLSLVDYEDIVARTRYLLKDWRMSRPRLTETTTTSGYDIPRSNGGVREYLRNMPTFFGYKTSK